jgi:site-specific recombinase XerD
MSALTVVPLRVPAAPDYDLQMRVVASCLQGLSEASRRVYSARIAAFTTWLPAACAFDRENVRRYLRSLELSGASPQVRNQTLAALKRLASEASELGWIDASEGARIGSIRSHKVSGVRTGRWLDKAQCARLLSLPDRTTVTGRRDACLLALLLGCGLRRSEACSLETAQLRTIEGRMVVTNLVGKGGRVRSVAVPRWAQMDIQNWIEELEEETAQ